MLCISTSFWVLKCFSVNFSIILLNWQAPIARGENDFFGKYVTELTRPHLGGTTRQSLNTGPPSCACSMSWRPVQYSEAHNGLKTRLVKLQFLKVSGFRESRNQIPQINSITISLSNIFHVPMFHCAYFPLILNWPVWFNL